MLRFAVLVLLLPLAACDTGTPESSAFEATITGDVDLQMQGAAGVVTNSPVREVELAIEMVEGGLGVRGVVIEDYSGDVDGRGTYALGENGLRLSYFDAGEEGAVGFVAESGTLRITRFNGERVTGSFSAVLRSASGEQTASAEGTFDALANESVLY